jgi:DNA mismatch repair protein MutS
MRQYFDIKHQYPDILLLFQVGDFYELFFDDAKNAAACLAIALTKRGTHNGEPIPLCGVPVHALDHYLSKLVRAGYKVALCDQLEEARPGKIVQRGVTQVLTPGTLTDTKLLDAKSASYLLSIVPGPQFCGLLFGELLTAQLYATMIPTDAHKSLESELTRFFPDEIIIPDEKSADALSMLCRKAGYFVSRLMYDEQLVTPHDQWMQQQFTPATFSYCNQQQPIKSALYYFYRYLSISQPSALPHFKSLQIYEPNDFLMLDRATQRNLELIENTYDGSARHTLFEILDNANTPMGSRMIKKWIMRPLVKQPAIEQRLDAVELLVKDIALQSSLKSSLKEVGDIERVVGRIALARALLHDYTMLKNVLSVVPSLKNILAERALVPLMHSLNTYIADFHELAQLLCAALNDDPGKEWIIKEGFDHRLDHIRSLVHHAQEKILALELAEQQATSINSLKIRYNGVQGYYIEVTKANMDAVPARYTRMQTLAGKERFMTPELQQLQQEIMQAQAEIQSAEKAVFESVKRVVFEHLGMLRKMAHAIAHIDALTGLAAVSYEQGYVRPRFNEQREILIQKGRHPVVERALGHTFMANDTALTDVQSTWIITGPNMGGKSTYLRQVALNCVMAHIGCFVPAQSASISILDRIFTRIGAGDQLAQGKSTFLIEMEETATICTQATRNSLVILDEIGRGTSTFDGLAIAQAVLEYLHTHIQARCLFATHYHELAKLSEEMPGVVSYYAASKKTENGIIFLYKMIHGVADGSFGVEVAKIAQLPQIVITRAQELLETLTSSK